MTIEISAFAWVPPFAQGYVKDLRPRWALAEAGIDYTVSLVGNGRADTPEYRAWQPFGQVPAYRDDEVELFESGAILLHIAQKSPALARRDKQEAATTTAWVFSALNAIEPKVDNMILPAIFHPGEPWIEGARAAAEDILRLRLNSLSNALGEKDWLTGRFGVADIVMASVLRGLQDEPILRDFPRLAAYLKRCLARPAFDAAIKAQLATFAENAPPEAAAS